MKYLKLFWFSPFVVSSCFVLPNANADETIESCRWLASKNPKAVKKWGYIPEIAKDRIKSECAAFGISIK